MLKTALVVAADAPIDNASWLSRGRHYDGNVRILIDEGPEPIYVARRFRLDEDHWLVRGMEVPVKIAPERPGEFGALGGQLVGGPGGSLGVGPGD